MQYRWQEYRPCTRNPQQYTGSDSLTRFSLQQLSCKEQLKGCGGPSSAAQTVQGMIIACPLYGGLPSWRASRGLPSADHAEGR